MRFCRKYVGRTIFSHLRDSHSSLIFGVSALLEAASKASLDFTDASDIPSLCGQRTFALLYSWNIPSALSTQQALIWSYKLKNRYHLPPEAFCGSDPGLFHLWIFDIHSVICLILAYILIWIRLIFFLSFPTQKVDSFRTHCAVVLVWAPLKHDIVNFLAWHSEPPNSGSCFHGDDHHPTPPHPNPASIYSSSYLHLQLLVLWLKWD